MKTQPFCRNPQFGQIVEYSFTNHDVVGLSLIQISETWRNKFVEAQTSSEIQQNTYFT